MTLPNHNTTADAGVQVEIARVQSELRHEPLSAGGENVSYAFDEGRKFALRQAIAIAEQWRDENKVSAARARKQGNSSMADQLDGAAIECNAIAGEIRNLLPQSPPAATQEEIDAHNERATGTPL